jgi:hypothetical protein
MGDGASLPGIERDVMIVRIRAHFDGKVIVPDEPVELPVDEPLEAELRTVASSARPSQAVIEERLRRLEMATGTIEGPEIPAEALRRENLYEERI